MAQNIDQIIEAAVDEVEKGDGKPVVIKSIGIWLPTEYRDKYRLLQAKTNKTCGRAMIKMVTRFLDLVEQKVERS